MAPENLLIELFVEELPPKALKKLGEAFAAVVADSLKGQGLAGADSAVTNFASPRRLAAHVTAVLAQAADKAVSQKLMPIAVGLDSAGNATPALSKRLLAVGVTAEKVAETVKNLKRAMDGKAETLFYESTLTGATLAVGLQKALEESIAKLPIPKVMSYQLESGCELPGWSSVSFVRPAHGLVALHGADVVPVSVLGLKAGRNTQGHRFEAAVSPVVLPDADSYAPMLLKDGAVIACFAERRAEIVRQLAVAAAKVGSASGTVVKPIDDDALLDEVTALVERPNVLVCEFEKQFLDVPQECLILTMKANQKYFPLLDAAGKLTNQFLVVSNISPADASAVIQGNERVVRPRLADAKFFFDQDRKKTLESRVEGLSKVVYHNKLGTQGERVERVRAIARSIGKQIFSESQAQNAYRAAHLAKADLLTEMVGEFPELQGVMGGYYARHDLELDAVAIAVEDHYKPRFAGDELPRNEEGLAVALADKLETLVGMFGIGSQPTGDKDPFALRRHALGVVRMLAERNLNIGLEELVELAWSVLDDEKLQRLVWDRQQEKQEALKLQNTGGGLVLHSSSFSKRVFESETSKRVTDYIYDRLSGYLREQGYSAQEVDAVVSSRSKRFGDLPKRLEAVRTFAAMPEAPALAAANKRIANILKKTDAVDPHVSEVLLKEPAEMALYAALKEIGPKAQALFEAGDYTASLQSLAALRSPVDAFFEDVMVNAEQTDLRLNRLGLLTALHVAMNRVADLSKLAS